jgi:PDZ domain
MKDFCKFFLILSFIMFSTTISFSQTTIYVSPEGKDSNPGTKEKPFATIGKAQSEARQQKEAVNIILRSGTYYLTKPVIITSHDQGPVNSSLVYRSFPGEKAVISGAVPLKLRWSKYKGGIWQAKVEKELIFDQLFVDGKLQRMARYPNYNPKAKFLGGTSADAIAPERVKKYKNPVGAYVHALHAAEWGDFHYVVKGRNEKGELILEGGWQNNRKMGMHKQHRFIENVFEELDTIGEWYFDKKAKTLYYYPSKSENLKTARIETPQISALFELRGSEKAPVRNITIDSIELTQTLRTFMDNKEQLLRSDWTTYRGGTVYMEGAEKCKVTNCYFNAVGGNAIYFSKYNRNNEVSGCTISYSGASGVSFVGDPEAVRSPSFEYNEFVPYKNMDLIPGPKTNNFPARCLVYNNLIHNIGYTEKQSAGIQISMSQEITLSHNTIYDVPRAGINISEGTWGGHMIEYNDVFNTVLETGDHGSFNSWGRDRYWHPNRRTMDSLAAIHPELILLDAVKTTTIRNNRFRCDHGWDIDLDDGSSNYEIYNNLCLNGGLKLREGFFRVVYNNIMINNSFHPHVWFRDSKDIFMHNIVSTAYAPIRIPFWGKFVNHNLFPDSVTLKKAQKNQTDQNSLVGNPLFVDPANGNYQVAAGSPALKAGFTNFEMDKFGVVSTRLKSIAKKVVLPDAVKITGQKGDEVTDFMGLKIKNLTTLGERSATGMSSETGVLIVDVPANSPFTGLLRPNDVILGMNGQPVTKIYELLDQNARASAKKSADFKIFRNQKEQIVTVKY